MLYGTQDWFYRTLLLSRLSVELYSRCFRVKSSSHFVQDDFLVYSDASSDLTLKVEIHYSRKQPILDISQN